MTVRKCGPPFPQVSIRQGKAENAVSAIGRIFSEGYGRGETGPTGEHQARSGADQRIVGVGRNGGPADRHGRIGSGRHMHECLQW